MNYNLIYLDMIGENIYKNGKHRVARRCSINAVNKIFQNIDIGYNVNWQ